MSGDPIQYSAMRWKTQSISPILKIVTRLFIDPFGLQWSEWTSGDISGMTTVWIASEPFIVATIAVFGISSRLLQRGAEAASRRFPGRPAQVRRSH